MTTTTRAQLSPPPRTIRTLTDRESHALDARTQMRAFTPANCITCHGAKTFRWLSDQGIVVAGHRVLDYDCRCVDQYVLLRYLLHCGIPLGYQRLGWSDLTYLSDDASSAAMDYIDHQQAYVSAGFGLVIWGDRGNGKSLLAYLLLKRLIADGVNVYATTFADMVSNFRGTWRDKEQEAWFSSTVRNAGVLFIDDLGREYTPGQAGQVQQPQREDNRPGAVAESMLEAVIRGRVSNAQPTIITTNFTPEQIQHGYGGHVTSLLGEKAIYVEVTGTDRRQEMNRRELEYAKQGLTRPLVLA